MTTNSRLLLALPLCFVVVLGCTKSSVPSKLTGKVAYKGAPVTGGTLTISPEGEGAIYSAPIKADGTYSIASIPAGEFVVTIETESANPNKKIPVYGGAKGKGAMSPGPEAAAAPSGDTGQFVKIPVKYNDKKKSGLTVTLVVGPNEKNFDLTD